MQWCWILISGIHSHGRRTICKAEVGIASNLHFFLLPSPYLVVPFAAAEKCKLICYEPQGKVEEEAYAKQVGNTPPPRESVTGRGWRVREGETKKGSQFVSPLLLLLLLMTSFHV